MSQTTSAFDEDLVRRLSKSLSEPDWLAKSRLDAFNHFASLPPEKNPLYTKYVGAFSFPLDPFKLTPGESKIDFRSFFGDFLTGRETDIMLQGNETQVHAELSDELTSKGVELMSFHEALKREEAKVRALVEGRLVRSEGDRFAAFVNAFFNSGTFVRVPRGVTLDRPLRRMLLLDSPKTSVVDQTFVVAEEGSKLVFLEEKYSKGGPSQAFVASTAEVVARPDSHVDFSSIQLLDEQTTHVSNLAVGVENDARATDRALSLGSSVSRCMPSF